MIRTNYNFTVATRR